MVKRRIASHVTFASMKNRLVHSYFGYGTHYNNNEQLLPHQQNFTYLFSTNLNRSKAARIFFFIARAIRHELKNSNL